MFSHHLMLLVAILVSCACSSEEKKHVAEEIKTSLQCIVVPDGLQVEESKNELIGVLLKRKYSNYQGKNIEYIVLKLDQPICVVGYFKNDEQFRLDGVAEIQLRVGSVDFVHLAKESRRVKVRGNLIHRADRDPGNTFTEIYFSVKNVISLQKE